MKPPIKQSTTFPSPEQIAEKIPYKGWKEELFQAMVKHYSAPYFSLIHQRINDYQHAEDVLQESFVKIWKGLKNFRGDSSIFSWGYRICINASTDHLRKHLRLKWSDADENTRENVQAEPVGYSEDQMEKVLHTAVESLSKRQQEVFVLRYFHEKTYAEIAVMLGVSEGSLKASYHHAAQKVEDFVRLFAEKNEIL